MKTRLFSSCPAAPQRQAHAVKQKGIEQLCFDGQGLKSLVADQQARDAKETELLGVAAGTVKLYAQICLQPR